MTSYINSREQHAVKSLKHKLITLLEGVSEATPIIVLCIGTDRVTGDSFGPLIGYKLKNSDVNVFGTLEQPVHAKNFNYTIKRIYSAYKQPFIISVDASLGHYEHIGYVSVCKGAIFPGRVFNKQLPPIGDISITGIVNYFSLTDKTVLHNTRLSTVMQMADVVSLAIKMSIYGRNRKNK